jgi:hypothetical protein
MNQKRDRSLSPGGFRNRDRDFRERNEKEYRQRQPKDRYTHGQKIFIFLNNPLNNIVTIARVIDGIAIEEIHHQKEVAKVTAMCIEIIRSDMLMMAEKG